MNELSYTKQQSISDEALQNQIGVYIKNIRQQQNKTQTEVAKAANISRSTLSLLERGEAGNLKTLIQILRVLDKLQTLEVFKFKETMSPLALAKAQHKTKERVRKPKEKIVNSNEKKSNW